MFSSQHIDARTRLFARVMGPYLVIVAVTALTHTSRLRTLLSEFPVNSAWAWVVGSFVLLAGLVVIALHQKWRGAAAIVVSALGWLTALKGLFLMAIPQTYLSAAGSGMDAVAYWRTALIVTGLVGLYLTYVGWAPGSSRPGMQQAPSASTLSSAAATPTSAEGRPRLVEATIGLLEVRRR